MQGCAATISGCNFMIFLSRWKTMPFRGGRQEIQDGFIRRSRSKAASQNARDLQGPELQRWAAGKTRGVQNTSGMLRRPRTQIFV
jgi:hypothetical protein